MQRLISRYYIFCFLMMSFVSYTQVINIENKRFLNDTNGWVGNADFTFNLIQNTQQVVSFSNTLRVQYQKNKSRFILLNDISFVKAGATNFVNSGYQHFRYNYKIAKPITIEAFTQTQYNPVLSLNFRYLIGAGPRLKILKKEHAKIYIASLYMFEYDDVRFETTKLYEHRLSSYITCTFSLGKNLELVTTTFYQPNLKLIADYRIANDTGLEIFINKHLNFKSSFNLLYDTYQPIEAPNLVYSFKNGLSVKF